MGAHTGLGVPVNVFYFFEKVFEMLMLVC
jgi:hypothetical protein